MYPHARLFVSSSSRASARVLLCLLLQGEVMAAAATGTSPLANLPAVSRCMTDGVFVSQFIAAVFASHR